MDHASTHLTATDYWCWLNFSPCCFTNYNPFMQVLWLGMQVPSSQCWAWASVSPKQCSLFLAHSSEAKHYPAVAGQSQIWICAIVFLSVHAQKMNLNWTTEYKTFLGTQVHKSKESAFLFPEKMKTHFKNPPKVFDSVCWAELSFFKPCYTELKAWTIGDLLPHSFQILISILEFLKMFLVHLFEHRASDSSPFYLSSSKYNFEIKV